MDAIEEQRTAEADAFGEQLKRTQLGSSSRSRHKWRAAADVDANWEQQLKRIDAIGEQQLKWTQLGSSSSDRELSAPNYSRRRTRGK